MRISENHNSLGCEQLPGEHTVRPKVSRKQLSKEIPGVFPSQFVGMKVPLNLQCTFSLKKCLTTFNLSTPTKIVTYTKLPGWVA